jgi:hypothetical protein
MFLGAFVTPAFGTDASSEPRPTTATKAMSKTTDQDTPNPLPVIRELSSDERAALEEGLDLAARIADVPRPLDISQVQRLYDDYLNEQITDSDAIIALGLAFGEEVRRKGKMVWARVIDEYGDETCVAAPKHMVNAAPISMIQKRLKRKERVNMAQLRDATIDAMEKQILTSMARE